MSFGDGDLHVLVAQLKTENARLKQQLDKLPEIVRCMDCRWGIDGGKYCAESASDSWDWRNVEPDGFCAWGELKEGGDD